MMKHFLLTFLPVLKVVDISGHKSNYLDSISLILKVYYLSSKFVAFFA